MVKLSETAVTPSQRQHGDWAAFISETKEDAIRQAREAQMLWERNSAHEYTILVGTLTDRVVFPQVYSVEAL